MPYNLLIIHIFLIYHIIVNVYNIIIIGYIIQILCWNNLTQYCIINGYYYHIHYREYVKDIIQYINWQNRNY